MVPHSLSIAKRKLIHISNFADILTKDRQFLGKLARISRIRHFSLDASQKHRLHAMARLFGRQRQQFHCFYTNACRLSHPARAALPRRFVSANRRYIVLLTQVNADLLRWLDSQAPLQMSGAMSHECAQLAENPPDGTPANALITVHLS